MYFLLLTACLYDRERFLELSEGFVDDDGDGYREVDHDCDDFNPEVNPGVVEICDGLDNDCDAEADEVDAADIIAWYQDLDQDGYGNNAVHKLSCEPPYLFSQEGGDCRDDDPSFHPGATELCELGLDTNCDGVAPEDSDGDGHDCDDCDDSNPDISPSAPEICNRMDDNCDGWVDNDPVDILTWYPDTDGDGYGDPEGEIQFCGEPPGYVSNGDDCDDSTADAAPGLSEVCQDGLDSNCDGSPGGCGPTGEIQSMALLRGLVANGQLGSGVASLGDINGDGYDDLLVGAPFAEIKLHTILGPFSGEMPVNLVSTLQMEGEDSLGNFLANAGDQTGDGRNDLLASSCMGDYEGDVYLFNSQLLGRYQQEDVQLAHISGVESGACTGVGLWGNFDWNDDGQMDVAVSSPFGAIPEISIVEGPLSGDLSVPGNASIRIVGDHFDDGLGSGWVAEDMDGNGMMDIAVGSLNYLRDGNHTGLTSIFRDVTAGTLSMSDADVQWWGEGESYLGYPISLADDQQGDGSPDLWIGASDNPTGPYTGTLRRVSSDAPSGLLADRSFVTVLGGESCCTLLSSDLNLDGTSDLAFGNWERVGLSYGKIYLFYGPLQGTLDSSAADAWHSGESMVGTYNLALAGDTDADGNLELVSGAPSEDSRTGAVVFLEVEVW